MGSTPIATRQLVMSLAAVALIEAAATIAARALPMPALGWIAVTRCAQTLAVLVLAAVSPDGLQHLGLQKESFGAGIKIGLAWSAAFAAVAGLGIAVLTLAGQHPLLWIRTPLPDRLAQRMLFFFVGGLVAPVAEEIVFRGLLFGYLRRWGVVAAALVSTALFAAVHSGVALPVTQVVGGIVFAVAYHTGKSLMVPIVIHMLGNLAIFSLSLLPIAA